ncbi:hypothetical protein [Brevundimonas sp.]|uniref:hypothetical protein n=1 Tax=Brevundimonas sp. TaxID=1871086 RepID=UPI002FCA358A
MPEWAFRPLLIGGVFAVLGVATWAFRALQGAPQPGVVKGSPYAAGGGILALVGALGFALVGVFFSDLSAPGQFLPWVLMVGAFATAGLALLYFYTGILARYDSAGVEIREWRRTWLHVPWSEVRKVRVSFMGSGVVFELQSGRKFSLSPDSGGLGELIETARKAQIPGAAKLLGLEDPKA